MFEFFYNFKVKYDCGRKENRPKREVINGVRVRDVTGTSIGYFGLSSEEKKMCSMYLGYGFQWTQNHMKIYIYPSTFMSYWHISLPPPRCSHFFKARIPEPWPTSKPSELPGRVSEIYSAELLLSPRYRGACSSSCD